MILLFFDDSFLRGKIWAANELAPATHMTLFTLRNLSSFSRCENSNNARKFNFFLWNLKQIAIGGEWFLKRKNENEKNLLLVAGGVGINPVLSMLRHLVVEKDSWENLQGMIINIFYWLIFIVLKYIKNLWDPENEILIDWNFL